MSGDALLRAEKKAAKYPRAVDIVTLAIFDRSERYRIGLVVRECDGSQYVACVGQMLTARGNWVRARTFNFRADELDELIAALQHAREILS